MIPTQHYGSMKRTNIYDSISSLFIVYVGTTINNAFWKNVFILNGISSTIAHSPYVHNKYPRVNIFFNYMDSITIWYVLLFYFIPDRYRLYIFILLFVLDYITDYLIYLNVVEKKYYLIYVIPILVDIFLKNSISYEILLLIAVSIATKIYQEKPIVGNIKVHTIWHILSPIMFKEWVQYF